MKAILFLLIAVASMGRAIAAEASVESLVASLAETDAASTGVDPFAIHDGFIAKADSLQFAGGVLGSPPPVVSPAMRELVARGTAAIPGLIAHLSDNTPTKLRVGDDFFMWRVFSDEYDPRDPSARRRLNWNGERPFGSGYVVRIGDICYSLLGQIVNRRLLAVRYQPTGGLVVNSPIETPELAKLAARDWRELDQKGHIASLTRDAKRADSAREATRALVRLEFYYPEEYARLKRGTLKRIIGKHEQQEHANSP